MKQLIMIGFLALLTLPGLTGEEKIYRQKDRATPLVIFNPQTTLENADGKALAHKYLEENWAMLGLVEKAKNLQFTEVKKGLVSDHYCFRQTFRGLDVENADVIVSISQKTGRIIRVQNNSYPEFPPMRQIPRFLLSKDDAIDVSWQHLRVFGDLTVLPAAKRLWMPGEAGFQLIYRVQIETNAPEGSWSLAIDAIDGEVLSARDTRINHSRKDAPDYRDYSGDLADRSMAEERIRNRMKRDQERLAKPKKRFDGRALVFDPDPKTTLGVEELQDISPAEAFADAYLERPLRDITFNETLGEYELIGPWCIIEDIAPNFSAQEDTTPRTPVSTDPDGFWDALRGDNKFNDAMTYYHIDTGQRYLQSLGFTGETGLQELPIRVDSDGFGGGDNSFFSGFSNILAFGHGCVDDNEDADVIHHEYGHAIQDVFDNAWSQRNFGDDSGAIGEGFGDYWGASYSIKTPNGLNFHPEWIYTWDGHWFGDSLFDFCEDNQVGWDGRNMDVIGAEYDPNDWYGDHENRNGFVSDELWGTPIFQAMMTLFKRGIPVSESDRIVVEGHRGLSAINITMPILAQSTVDVARMLHPNGPHAQVFQEAFARHNILPHLDNYTYFSTHVPPSGDSGAWTNEIELNNPNQSTVNVTATIYESDATGIGLSTYQAGTPQNFTLAANETFTFQPGGSNQRWVRFDSDLPLAGTSFFRRDLGDVQGTEKAGIPLFSETETGTEIILPHVPANRTKFWSGAVLVNPGDTTSSLTIDLIGEAGNNLNHLLAPSAPTSLEPFQKWVTFLAPGPGGAEGIFDDSASAEKVSYVKFTGSNELAGFQLFGYQASENGEVATAGIMATPDQNRTHYPIRVSLTDSEWAGFTLLNPSDQFVSLNVRALNLAGDVLGETDITMSPRQKLLGLNVAGSFKFPSNAATRINLANGEEVQMVQVTMDDQERTFGISQPLRVFELGGDLNNTELDGGAVNGLANRVVFTKPAGKLEIFKTVMAGNITVTTRTGNNSDTQIHNLNALQSLQLSFLGDLDSIEVSGEFFNAVLIDRDSENGSLTIVNGKPLEFTTHGE